MPFTWYSGNLWGSFHMRIPLQKPAYGHSFDGSTSALSHSPHSLSPKSPHQKNTICLKINYRPLHSVSALQSLARHDTAAQREYTSEATDQRSAR